MLNGNCFDLDLSEVVDIDLDLDVLDLDCALSKVFDVLVKVDLF